MSEERLSRIENEVVKLREDVSEIKLTISKQRGFVAGFSAAFTLLWAMIVGLVVYIWKGMT